MHYQHFALNFSLDSPFLGALNSRLSDDRFLSFSLHDLRLSGLPSHDEVEDHGLRVIRFVWLSHSISRFWWLLLHSNVWHKDADIVF